ncbi:hypothetical protein [Anabaena sp. UHCC 0204]|uniref:hypothetical protein n=1 Tax=Anabaena sp. UHCC 0204 TaxID=2590009 RepID=UPI001447B7EC|nr:hypothetical protein [Anabaena sp. UHCC 0204]
MIGKVEDYLSKLVLKIVVMTREQKRGFGRFYFSLHITLPEAIPRLRFFYIHLLSKQTGITWVINVSLYICMDGVGMLYL